MFVTSNVFKLIDFINASFIHFAETVTELMISDLLRPTKKLRYFHKQPLSHLSDLSENDVKLRRKRLCYWLFEDRLKSLYEQFVKLLNTAAHDSVQNNREKAIASMMKLLQENREQEEVSVDRDGISLFCFHQNF